MTFEETLRDSYKKLSIQELLQIVNNRPDYSGLETMIAIQELSARNVSLEAIEASRKEYIKSPEYLIAKDLVAGLSDVEKCRFYFLWLPFLSFTIKRNFREKGFALKLKQVDCYAVFGFVILVVALILFIQYGITLLGFLIVWILGFLPAFIFDDIFYRKYQIHKLNKLYGVPDEFDLSGDLFMQWKRAKIELHPPATIEQFDACEKVTGFVFPGDFKMFYQRGNGFKSGQMDDHLLCLWSLETIQYEYVREGDFVGFADFMIYSHQIGFIKGKHGVYRSYDDTLICETFDEFIAHWEAGDGDYM